MTVAGTTEHPPNGQDDHGTGRGVGSRGGSVVLGFDGSPRAWIALKAAEREAARRGTGLELLAVPGAGGSVTPRPRSRRRPRPPGGGERVAPRNVALTAAVGGARRLIMSRRPGLVVTATVLLSDQGPGPDPLAEAGVLVLGWVGPSPNLRAGLGAPGLSLLRGSRVPVLVVPPGYGPQEAGPVVLLLRAAPAPRAFEVAVEECRHRGVALSVVRGVGELDRARSRHGPAAVVVAPLGISHGEHGLSEPEVSQLVETAHAHVLLVPPAVPDLPRPRPRPDGSRAPSSGLDHPGDARSEPGT